MSFVDVFYFLFIFVSLYVTVFNLNLLFKYRKGVKKSKGKGKLPKVSIVVPAYNEEKTIIKTLQSILALNYPKKLLEIIVVDDGSTDGTYLRAKEFTKYGVKVFTKPNTGKSATLNFGIRRASGELIAVVDCDTILDKDALLKCVRYFDDPKVASVTARILQRRKRTIFERWQDIELKIIAYSRKLMEYINLITVTPGPLSIYRKEVLERVGGFDEKCILEDNEIAWRLLYNGYRIRMAYDAIAFTNMPESLKMWWKQRVRWCVGGLQIARKYISALFRRHPIGTYVLPLWILGYIFSGLGLGLYFFLLTKALSAKILFFAKTIAHGGKPFVIELSLEPNIFLFYGFILFTMSLFFMLNTILKYRDKPKFFDSLTFLFVYLALYPVVTTYSTYKFFRMYNKLKLRSIWFTK